MRRREFISLLGGAAAAWPLPAAAQQQVTSPRRIGVLLVGLSPESKEAKQFRLGLRDAGYSEGRDVVIEWRSANGDYDRVPELVADLGRVLINPAQRPLRTPASRSRECWVTTYIARCRCRRRWRSGTRTRRRIWRAARRRWRGDIRRQRR